MCDTHTNSMYCIKYLGDNDSERKAILRNILLFTWPVVYSTGDKERERKKGGTERRKEERPE